jgi:hypothetical protein
MEHIKFAADIGFLLANAKAAAENPELDEKLSLWKDLPQEEKDKLLGLSYKDESYIQIYGED